jgi:hypothetical protein
VVSSRVRFRPVSEHGLQPLCQLRQSYGNFKDAGRRRGRPFVRGSEFCGNNRPWEMVAQKSGGDGEICLKTRGFWGKAGPKKAAQKDLGQKRKKRLERI